ncbi:LytR/AlgR family response regulator transcription factor [Sphingosinicella terrae]|uniref:LytR/AlgR family response regulator transcription factor n=1 Tax=Sphingosinicella terrae TaxID=2172047 RepID=UPI0013B36665|nr:LytTR family DNA-binding domain-containing protein [Sphingosinicella terrae]
MNAPAALRVLTVDDEPLARRRLKRLLDALPEAQAVGEAGGCAEAIEKAGALVPDVVLLDIRMRDGDGFAVAEALSRAPEPPAIVFVTAFDRFALRAFETIAADYLLKPVERERLAQALDKARARRAAQDAQARIAELQSVVAALRAGTEAAERRPAQESEFWLRHGSGTVRVAAEAITHVGSEDEYVRLYTPAGSWLMRGSIRQLEARLDPGAFVRVHRKWLVRRSEIVEVRRPRLGRAEVVLSGGQRVPAGRVHVRALKG